MAEFVYLTQDFSWNAHDDRFLLTLHSEILPSDLVQQLNQSVQYEDIRNGTIAIFQHQQLSAIVFCRCKAGHPTGGLAARFEDASRLLLTWPGVLRAFVRVRIMESTTAENMTVMLLDDLEGGHSLSDVDDPEQDQSFRPWSDDEESDSGAAGV